MRSLQTAVLAPEPIETPETVTAIEPASLPSISDQVSVGYLRAFITVLVLAHHAVLAYHPFAPKPPASLVAEPRWWQAFPIADSQRWGGFGLLVGFNDVFFMALMFFLSGLFVWASLERQGSGAFLRQRALRLGLPFLAVAAVVAPLAYYPAYLQTGATSGIAGFWHQWSGLGNWPAGPAWFLWVLLAFDAVAAGLYLLWPRWGHVLGRVTSGARRRPALFFGLLVAVSAAAYLPMALAFNPFVWSSFGPFFFQTSRLFHYAVYFLAGAAVGAFGLQEGLLAPDGKLARRWPLWLTASFVAFSLIVAIMIMASSPSLAGSRNLEIIGGLIFALSCAASSFAALAIFVRFARKSHPVLDSLRKNAYGMYLLHYVFVSWLQYLLLKAPLSGLTKGSLVFLGTLLLSWAATAALRRLPAVARVI
jgi:surface polysaccharide O-acyltransferase-like enzyme